MWRITIAAVTTIPLVVSSGADAFRLPKEEMLLAVAIVIAALMLASAIIGQPAVRSVSWPRDVRVLVIVIVAWSTITMLMATNRRIAATSLTYELSAAAIFLSTAALACRRSLAVANFPLAPAILNGSLLTLQSMRIWEPFAFANEQHIVGRLRLTALIGNPNDIGAFFTPCCIIAAAMAYARPRSRPLYVIVALICALAIVLSQTLTAIAAVSAGLLTALFLQGRRTAFVKWIFACIAIVGTILAYAPVRGRIEQNVRLMRQADLNRLLDGRLTAALAGMHMFAAHPIFGVGPGCYGFNYFDAKIAAERLHPQALQFVNTVNYGEAHNDHIQVLASFGLPGYLLFLASLAVLARRSARRTAGDQEHDERRRFVSFSSASLAASLGVLALASFPLELAAVMCVYGFGAGLCVAWSPAQ